MTNSLNLSQKEIRSRVQSIYLRCSRLVSLGADIDSAYVFDHCTWLLLMASQSHKTLSDKVQIATTLDILWGYVRDFGNFVS